MKAKILSVALAVCMILSCMPIACVFAASDSVIINQVYGGGTAEGGPFDHSFIELYNASNKAVDLTDYTVGYSSQAKKSKGGTGGAEVKTALKGSIPANSSYLISCGALTTTDEFCVAKIENADLTWDQVINNKQICVKLYDKDGKQLDGVAAVDSATTVEDLAEGKTFASGTISKNKSVRRVNLTDTDDNATDFATVKFQKSELQGYYDVDKFVAAYGPKSVKSGSWTETKDAEENFIGYDFISKSGYTDLTKDAVIGAAGLTVDSKTAVTAKLDADVTVAQYAIVVAKASDDAAGDPTVAIGNKSAKWTEWTDIAGTALTKLTNEFKAYYIDLETSGMTAVNGEIADLGITVESGSVTVAAVRLTNTKSGAEAKAQAILDAINVDAPTTEAPTDEPTTVPTTEAVEEKVDLSISSVLHTPSDLTDNDNAQFSAVIRNLGTTALDSDVTVAFYANGRPFGKGTLKAGLEGGKTATVKCEATIRLGVGTRTVSVVVNNEKTVVETDHTNNVLKQKVSITDYIPSTDPTTEAPTDEPTTEAPTDEPTTEAPTDEPTTEAPTDEPTTEAPTEPGELKDIILDGDENHASSMIGTYKNTKDGYKYLGFATTKEATGAYKYLVMTYTGNITEFRIQFENQVDGNQTLSDTYWFSPDQDIRFVTADGSAIPMNGNNTTIVIDLEKSGINLDDYNFGIQMHGDKLLTNGDIVISNAYLTTTLPDIPTEPTEPSVLEDIILDGDENHASSMMGTYTSTVDGYKHLGFVTTKDATGAYKYLVVTYTGNILECRVQFSNKTSADADEDLSAATWFSPSQDVHFVTADGSEIPTIGDNTTVVIDLEKSGINLDDYNFGFHMHGADLAKNGDIVISKAYLTTKLPNIPTDPSTPGGIEDGGTEAGEVDD